MNDQSRFSGKPWWQMPIGQGQASAGAAVPVAGQPVEKGHFGGECQKLSCANKDAHWFNETNGRYYCAPCARGINDVCKRNGQEPLCELHPGSNPNPRPL